MKFGRFIGILLEVVGIVFIMINIMTLTSIGSYLPKLFVAGIFMSIASIGFIISPGPDFSRLEKNIDANFFWKKMYNESTGKDKIIWAIFFLLGITACFIVFQYLGLSLV